MKFFITRKRLIKEFARQIAILQKKADKWYYIHSDQSMSSYTLDKVIPLRDMCRDLGIEKQVYEEAYKIYDFRNSGKDDYEPDLELLKNYTY
jgi:hypothetical protein